MATYCVECVIAFVFTFHIKLLQGHECDLGFYGRDCDKKCGQCLGGHGFCDALDGFCVNGCSWGFQGGTCTEVCPPTFWGYNCDESCSFGCVDQMCNATTGVCAIEKCLPGFLGQRCKEVCPENKYGDDCRFTCKCSRCGCNPVDGTCHTECPTKQWDSGMKIEYAQAPDSSSDDNIQMMCPALEETFKDILAKVNSTYPVPLWPLFYILPILFLLYALKMSYDLYVYETSARYQDEWLRRYIGLEEIENKKSVIEEEPPAESKTETPEDNEAEEEDVKSETT